MLPSHSDQEQYKALNMLEKNMLNAGAKFLFESRTEECYRLWSIRDIHPAMIRVDPSEEPCTKVDVEVWEVPAEGLISILQNEPEGLTVCRARLEDGRSVLSVVGEPILVRGMKEITEFGGWRKYLASLEKNG